LSQKGDGTKTVQKNGKTLADYEGVSDDFTKSLGGLAVHNRSDEPTSSITQTEMYRNTSPAVDERNCNERRSEAAQEV